MFYITDTFVKFQILIGCLLFWESEDASGPRWEWVFPAYFPPYLHTSYLTPSLGHLDCLGHLDNESFWCLVDIFLTSGNRSVLRNSLGTWVHSDMCFSLSLCPYREDWSSMSVVAEWVFPGYFPIRQLVLPHSPAWTLGRPPLRSSSVTSRIKSSPLLIGRGAKSLGVDHSVNQSSPCVLTSSHFNISISYVSHVHKRGVIFSMYD